MQFFKHAIHGGLYKARIQHDRSVQVYPQGGGLTMRLSVEAFAEAYTPVTPDFTYRSGTVSAEFLPNEVVLPCYGNGKRWNGWGMPCFTLEVGKQLLEHIPDLSYDEQKDVFVWKPYDAGQGEPPDVYEPFAILVGREPLKVYAIGSGYWTWESVSLPDDITM